MGLGYASACLSDEWAIFNNPAGLAKVKQTTAGFSYDAMPTFKSFNRMAALITVPSPAFTTAVGAFRFGDALYNEQFLSAGIANKLGLASLGLRFNYIQYHAEGFGTYTALTVSFGGIAELTKTLHIGAHITNINQPVINKQTGEKIPTIMTLGMALIPSEKIFLTSEVEKDLDHKMQWKAGLEYKALKKFTVRTGVNLNPEAAFLGFGWRGKKFIIDYGIKYNPNFGTNHQATVVYPFTKAK